MDLHVLLELQFRRSVQQHAYYISLHSQIQIIAVIKIEIRRCTRIYKVPFGPNAHDFAQLGLRWKHAMKINYTPIIPRILCTCMQPRRVTAEQVA